MARAKKDPPPPAAPGTIADVVEQAGEKKSTEHASPGAVHGDATAMHTRG